MYTKTEDIWILNQKYFFTALYIATCSRLEILLTLANTGHR